MDETTKLALRYFESTVGQVQRYLMLSLAAALFFMVLSLGNGDGADHVSVPLAGFAISADVGFARVLAALISVVAGAMASYSEERADRIFLRLDARLSATPEGRSLLRTVRMYPSVATESYPLVRIVAALAPGMLLVAGLIIESADRWDSGHTLLAGLLAVPSVTLATELWNPPFAESQGTESS